MTKGPIKGTQIAGGRYYLVKADGKKRIWVPLTKVRDGLPAFYAALAKELNKHRVDPSKMPLMIAAWEADVMVRHSPKWQNEQRTRGKVIADAFEEFHAHEVTTPDVSQFLEPFRPTPRTFNAYRSQIREYMRYAEEKGYRPAGSNPVTAIRTISIPHRDRCPSTSELRRVKIGCLYGDDGKRNRSGITMACLIEMAYLTGQDVGVLIRVLEQKDPMQPTEPYAGKDGIYFMRDKTSGHVVIEWTPRLRACVNALLRLKAERKLKKRAQQRVVTPCLFTLQDGKPMTYEAAANAWQRGIKRSKVLPFMFRDIRAAAMTDKEEREGIGEANKMGTHTTEQQTADYVRRRRARKTKATA